MGRVVPGLERENEKTVSLVQWWGYHLLHFLSDFQVRLQDSCVQVSWYVLT